jgi:hypothetical protein
MTWTSNDLRKLGLPLAIMLALFAIAFLLGNATQQDVLKAEHERNTAAAAKNQIEQRLRQVRTEELDIKERTQILQRLQNSGITGEEKRLDWLEMLRDTQRDLRIPGMKYEFGAQTALDGNGEANVGWYSSPLKIQFRLLHEEDLLNTLKRIEKNAKSLVIVRACKLSPLPEQGDGRTSMALLGAECDMQWLTVRQPSGKS